MKRILSAVVVMGILLTGCPSKQVEKVTDKAVVTTVDAGTTDAKAVVAPPTVNSTQSPVEQVVSPKQSVEQK